MSRQSGAKTSHIAGLNSIVRAAPAANPPHLRFLTSPFSMPQAQPELKKVRSLSAFSLQGGKLTPHSTSTNVSSCSLTAPARLLVCSEDTM